MEGVAVTKLTKEEVYEAIKTALRVSEEQNLNVKQTLTNLVWDLGLETMDEEVSR